MRLGFSLMVTAMVLAACDTKGDGSAGASDATSGGSGTSGETAGETGDYGGECVEHVTVLSGVDVVGITGQSAAEVLAQSEGLYDGGLSWIDNVASHVNVGTDTPVQVEVTWNGGEIRDIDAELVHPCQHLGPCPCEDRLEIDVDLRIVSQDGAVSEQVVAALTSIPTNYTGPAVPHFYHRFDPDAVPGWLQGSDIVVPDGATLREVVLTAEFRNGACTGALNAEVEMMGGIGFGPFANWGAVTEVTGAACNELSGSACAGAGCTAVTGREVYGACSCADPVEYCFAEASAGETTELWARPYYDYEQVVAFEGLAEPLPEPWIPCSDVPDNPACQCFSGMPACP